MKEEEIGDLERRFSALADQCVPYNGMLELTRRCSVRCTHCYLGDARWVQDQGELSTKEFFEILDMLKEVGTLWLFITGGEPLMRRDYREIWSYAYSKGFVLVLFTNATLLDQSTSEFLTQYPPARIEVSIYGATEETYERVTLVKGSFERFMRGIGVLRASGFSWELKTTLLNTNLHEIAQMKALASEWGVRFASDGALQASTGEGVSGGLSPCASRLRVEDWVTQDLSEKNYCRDMIRGFYNQELQNESQNLYRCGAGKSTFYISATGILQMCSATIHRGIPLKGNPSLPKTFEAGWQKFQLIRQIKQDPQSPCYQCDIAHLCQSCPAYAWLEVGSEQGVVAWMCEAAHLKAERLGLPHCCRESHYKGRSTSGVQQQNLELKNSF